MKKKVLIFVFLFFLSSSLSVSTNADEKNDNLDSISHYNIEPHKIGGLSACDNDDQYEGNDSIVYSTKIPLLDYANSGETKNIYATIDKDPFYCLTSIDKDYYYFNLYTTSDVIINLSSIPQGTNYNINLLDGNENFLVGSSNSYNSDETIIRQLQPGTYYIYVYSSDGYDNSDSYKLSIDYSPVSFLYDNVSISSYMDLGYKAAVWESEFKPFGYTSSTYDGQGVGTLVLSPPMADSFDKTIYDELKGDVNVSRVLYIWDQEFKTLLLSDVISLLTIMEPYTQGNDMATIKLIVSSSSQVLSILFRSFPNLSLPISIAGFFIPLLLPSDEILVNDMYIYLSYLKGILQGTENDDQVVKIETFYDFESRYKIDATIQTYYLTYGIFYNSNYNAIYDDEYIYYEQDKSKFWGDIKGIRDFSSIDNMLIFIDNRPSGC